MATLNKIDTARFGLLLSMMSESSIPRARLHHVYHYVMGDERDKQNCEDAIRCYLECRVDGDPAEVANKK